ncbi:MAG: ATP-binding cassette domain-containing protein [Treponema sp.]|nr:ATP-binding cassette domain-containing protein [Treponema sp.]
MKQVLRYIKSRPLAFISLIVLIIMYSVMVFAPFFAPYAATKSFDSGSFHPSNIEISRRDGGIPRLCAREFRVLNPVTWRYAKVKGLSHKISFFVKGDEYQLFGVKCSRHLFGTKPDEETGEIYPIFLFGADNLGRDLFSRMVYGSRISLTIGFVASFISLILAIVLGGLAGFYGGKCDWTIMRFSEFFMLIPGFYLILFLRSLLNTKMDTGQSYMVITLILSLVGWPASARMLRGMIHAIKREEFVQNAILEGIPSTVIIFTHIIPQLLSLLIVSTTLAVPGFIMSETALSYLGLGIADPAVSWGSLINRDISTLSNIKNFPWLLTPVFLLLAVTLAFNFIGDALRDFYDPYSVKKCKKARANDFSTNALSQAASSESGADSPFLSVKDLNVSFSILRGTEEVTVHSVRGVSFQMNRGEILGIVGESGSGKTVTTTAIPALHGDNATISGEILFCGENLTNLPKEKIREFRGKKIGMIFQEPGRSFDPLQNMESVFLESFRNSQPLITKEEARKKAVKLLGEVGLPDPEKRLSNFPHQFSGGQLQRIGIALSLAQGCELLIADEPTTALDVTIQAQIVELLRNLRKKRNLSIIFISHNINLVADLCDRIIVMYGGIVMDSFASSELEGWENDARHKFSPYAKALLASTPKFGMHYTTERLVSIPGRVTDPANPETGCPFAPRCQFAKDECKKSAAFSSCWKMR